VDPLGKESADEMLNALLGSDAGVGPLKRFIAEKSEGNPLFMEEIYLALIEEGVLVRNGAVKITRSLSQLKIPATLQAILAARIDRLPGDQKGLLETVAVNQATTSDSDSLEKWSPDHGRSWSAPWPRYSWPSSSTSNLQSAISSTGSSIRSLTRRHTTRY
jgi:hypothetical protein